MDVPRSDSRVALEACSPSRGGRPEHSGRSGAQLRRAERRLQGRISSCPYRRAACFSAPVIFYQLWAFIAPGLYKKEKKVVIPFVFFSTVLFVGGGLFGWRVAFPVTFEYFLGWWAAATPSSTFVPSS